MLLPHGSSAEEAEEEGAEPKYFLLNNVKRPLLETSTYLDWDTKNTIDTVYTHMYSSYFYTHEITSIERIVDGNLQEIQAETTLDY